MHKIFQIKLKLTSLKRNEKMIKSIVEKVLKKRKWILMESKKNEEGFENVDRQPNQKEYKYYKTKLMKSWSSMHHSKN